MRSKLIRMGVLAVGLIGLLGTATPAQATTEATATFTGIATTSPIGYPCTPVGSPCPVPPTVGTGDRFGFTFSSTVCVGAKTDIAKPTKGSNVYGPSCSIQAAGTATGFCGLSASLTATANIEYSGPTGTKSITTEFSFTSTGSLLLISGTGQKTPGGPAGMLTGVVQATPIPSAPGGPSCTNGTQTDFLVTGEVSYTEVTPVP